MFLRRVVPTSPLTLLNLCRYNHVKTDSNLEIKEIDGVRYITMNDNKTRNSLSNQMMDNLIDAVQRNQNDVKLRAIVLTSSGPVFSAGHNLKELSPDQSYESHHETFKKCHELIKSVILSPLPVIAKVDGLAAGKISSSSSNSNYHNFLFLAAGLQLMASCDIAVCSQKSSFSTPGVSFGIFCSTPGIALARVAPRMTSSYMLLTGLPIKADEALRAGLVSSVVSSEELDNEIQRIVNAIKMKSREVVSLGKKFFHQQLRMDLNSAYVAGAKIMADNLQLDDGKEGIKSFIEKRKPTWKN